MKIAVIHNQVDSKDSPDTRDVLVQAEAVSQALTSLGHQALDLSCTLNLEAIHQELQGYSPDLIFNLVEDLGGHGRLIHLFPSLLDALGLPYTGSPAEAIYTTSHKTLSKEIMRHHNLPTPIWQNSRQNGSANAACISEKSRRWIIKSLWEHASLGLNADSVLETDSAQILATEMAKRSPMLGGACFAEEFIEGREFNLSILDSENGAIVLPPAEIVFQDYTQEMVRIVDYQAKWEEDSFGYNNTVRTFDFGPEDAELLTTLQELSLRCWRVFGLKGYARVDFRVDATGQPFILEVNANPCLSPDAGFCAALHRYGLNFNEAIQWVVISATLRQ